MISLRPGNVRTRLTLWYVAVLGSVLLLYVGGTSTYLFFKLRGDLDHMLAEDLETVERLLRIGPDGDVRPGGGWEERLMEVRSPDGALLYRNERLGNYTLGGSAAPGEGQGGYSGRSGRLPDGARIRIVSRLHTIGGRPVLIRLADREDVLWHEFGEMLSVLLAGLPVALAIAGGGGYALARRVLEPLDSMARRAEQISAERLGERLPVENPADELGHLARVFNDALARLERSFEQLRRFTADASHELRTPLTAIRSVGEVGLQKGGDSTYYRDIIGSMLEESGRLTRLVDSLLTISRADAGQIQLRRSTFSLLDLAKESAALLEVLAEEKAQRLSIEGDAAVAVHADRLILRQALVNLIDNAVKYSPAGAALAVRVALHNAGAAVVEVRDGGPGIEPAHQEKVFDRFYRVDKARSRDAGGAGLGLSIAKWAVEAHGGRIELESEHGRGCTFRICLPAAQEGNRGGSGGE